MLDQIKQYNLVFPDGLVNNIYQLKTAIKADLRSNCNGWQSPQYTSTKEVGWIDDFLKECLSIAEINKEVSHVWFNINPKGAYHRWHSHGGATQVGVFYISVPENSGNIEFRYKKLIHSIAPYNGLLLIFPAGLEHQVLSSRSNQDRITMAFNINT